jgi:hypothetical protein
MFAEHGGEKHVTMQEAHMTMQAAHVTMQEAHVTMQEAHVTMQEAHVTMQEAHMTMQEAQTAFYYWDRAQAVMAQHVCWVQPVSVSACRAIRAHALHM